MLASRRFRNLLVLTLLVLVPAVRDSAGATRPVTITDLLGVRSLEYAPVVSPDGKNVLFVVSDWEPSLSSNPTTPPKRRSHLWIMRTDGRSPARQLTFGEAGEYSPAWSPDGTSISFVATRDGNASLWLMRIDGGEARAITRKPIGAYHWSPNGQRIAFTMTEPPTASQEEAARVHDDAVVSEAGGARSHLWMLDPVSGDVERLTSGDSFTVNEVFSWSPDSRRIVFQSTPTTAVRDYRFNVSIVDLTTKQCEPITVGKEFRDESPTWSADGKLIAFWRTSLTGASNVHGIPAWMTYAFHLMTYDVSSRKIEDRWQPAWAEHSLFGMQWAPDSRRILFNLAKNSRVQVVEYDVTTKAYRFAASLEGTTYLASFSADGSVAALVNQSPQDPSNIFIADGTLANRRRLTDLNPQTHDFSMGETSIVRWTSTDGEAVEGVLIKPVGFQPGTRYPLLVHLHGGPTGHYSEGFEAGGVYRPAQFWAGRGWAVFYPNFRGSDGFGEAFTRGIVGDWATQPYKDVMAGVDYLIATGVADSERLAVTGASYGGYLTNWTVTQTRRFKAASAQIGMSELESFYGETAYMDSQIAGFMGGPPIRGTRDRYRTLSPMTFVDDVRTPILIIHGAQDRTVPVGQSQQWYRALRDRDQIAELVLYPREGHGVQEYTHQRDYLRRIYTWIVKYTLGPDANTAALDEQ